jgi:UDP-N-acetylmuramate dehydrogenase
MMMAAPRDPRRLIERLPRVRGRLTENAPLAPITWFRVGGPAEVMFRPADVQDLTDFLIDKPLDVPITVLGVASNVLVRDGGVPGVVIRLGRPFAEVAVSGAEIYAGAAALDANVARFAGQAGLGGVEFLSGIPGTIGGALRMNAGAYGAELRDVLLGATAIDGNGRHHELTVTDLKLSYRRSDVPDDWIFLHATLQGVPTDPDAIGQRMLAIQAQRNATQPVRSRTGGSTFANPAGHKAWELIDRAGCRGLRRGDAMVSELHANFLINLGNATAADLEGLGEEIRRLVQDMTGVMLDWEIKRIGTPVPRLMEAPL